MSGTAIPPAVDVRGMGLSYGAVVALADIDIAVAAGEFLALLGPSGCGKTSLLRSIAGYVHPQQGAIRINGQDVLDLPPRRRNIGMVFQSYALFPHMSAAENIAFGLKCRGVPRDAMQAAVQHMLGLVGLVQFADRKPARLSGGQQQRVALARALVIKPDVLLLDEALSALDKSLRVQMQTELKEIQRRFGIATVFVTHDQEEAMAMADRIAVMRDGRVEQLASPEELFRAPETPWVADFIGAGNLVRGRVRRNGEEARLDVAPGVDCAAPGDLPDGVEVTGFVRSDRIELTYVGADGRGIEVVGRRFLGSRVEILLRHEKTELRVVMPGDGADTFVPGTRARATIAKENCRLFARVAT